MVVRLHLALGFWVVDLLNFFLDQQQWNYQHWMVVGLHLALLGFCVFFHVGL